MDKNGYSHEKALSLALSSVLMLGVVGTVVAADLKSEKQKSSYALGINLSHNLKTSKMELEKDALLDGLSSGLKGSKMQMSDAAIKQTLMAFQQKMPKQRIAELDPLIVASNTGSVSNRVSTNTATPNEILKKATDELLVVINRDREKIKKHPGYVLTVVKKYLIPHIDFVSAARWVLGKHASRASNKEKVQFILEFQTLMIRFYASALREYLINSEKEIKKEMIQYYPVKLKPGDKEVIVRSEIIPSNGKKVPIHFRMHVIKGKWKIFDVSVDGISVVTTYRTSFSSQIRKKGLAAVIASLKKRNESLSEIVKKKKVDSD